MCPGASDLEHAIQYTESRRCDHRSYRWDNVLHIVPEYERRKLFHSYTYDPFYGLDGLRNVHPHQSERHNNGIDDDCDGYVDETEYAYKEFGNSVSNTGFKVRVVINDEIIRDNANFIVAVVYELDNIKGDDQKDIMRGFAAVDNSGNFKFKKVFGFPYLYSDRRVTLDINDKAFDIDKKVYAVGLLYFRLVPTLPWLPPLPLQIGCVDNSGNPDYWFMFTGGICSTRNRIVSDIYFGAVGASPQKTKRQTAIVNRAIYEWNLSERGLVGGQDLEDLNYYGFDLMPYNEDDDIITSIGLYPAKGGIEAERAPDGTRYTAEYGEDWCTEFSASVFRAVSLEVDLETNVEDMMDWFEWNAEMLYGATGRAEMSTEEGLVYGSYLAMNPGKDEEGKKGSHSGIFLGVGPGAKVWRLHGCTSSERIIKLENDHEIWEWEHDPDTGYQWYFVGLGKFTDQFPTY